MSEIANHEQQRVVSEAGAKLIAILDELAPAMRMATDGPLKRGFAIGRLAVQAIFTGGAAETANRASMIEGIGVALGEAIGQQTGANQEVLSDLLLQGWRRGLGSAEAAFAPRGEA